MKFLKYLLGLVLLLAIIFIAKGLLTPSISCESQIIVDKAAQESWAVMSDKSNLPKWIKGFKSTELVSGTENTVGAVSNIYIEENGDKLNMQETINRIRPNELLDLTFTMDFMDIQYLMTMVEENGKTTIKTTTSTSGNGIIAKSILSFMKSAMKKQEDENLENLKNIIEENTKNYFSIPETVMTK